MLHGIFYKYYFDVLLSSFSVGMVLIYTVVDFIYTDAINDAVSVVSAIKRCQLADFVALKV